MKPRNSTRCLSFTIPTLMRLACLLGCLVSLNAFAQADPYGSRSVSEEASDEDESSSEEESGFERHKECDSGYDFGDEDGSDGAGCTPDCEGKECGADGCGGSCGECEVGMECDDYGQCLDVGSEHEEPDTGDTGDTGLYDYGSEYEEPDTGDTGDTGL